VARVQIELFRSVGEDGIEPPTSGLNPGALSLSYSPVFAILHGVPTMFHLLLSDSKSDVRYTEH
jgi:hypothetical protein